MRNIFVISALLLAAALFAAPDYADKRNWLIAGTGEDRAGYDVFYIHPTLLSDAKNPYPDFGSAGVRDRLRNFSAAQAGIFAGQARIFVPAVRQLEFRRCISEMENGRSARIPESSLRFAAVEDTAAAFRHYLENWNDGRPYILFGHSQGAADLYELLCREPGISPERGFVAAYLAGLPGLTAGAIKKDLSHRGILPAQDEGSAGVVVIWNTRLPGGGGDLFTTKGGYGINPLNWRTDTLEGASSLHRGIVLFDHRTCKELVPGDGKAPVCSARLDENGSLIAENVPEAAKKLYAGFLSPRCCHAGDVWMFARNIVENAGLRVKLHRMKSELDRAKELIRTGRAECVVLKNGRIAGVERGRGVSPLLRLYDRDRTALRDGILVDKVIGRAAAAIAICGGARFVHGGIMSEDAQSFLKANGSPASCTLMVRRILNQRRDGLCPLEKSVQGITEPAAALAALRRRVDELRRASGRKKH